jgi:hypothetical protein
MCEVCSVHAVSTSHVLLVLERERERETRGGCEGGTDRRGGREREREREREKKRERAPRRWSHRCRASYIKSMSHTHTHSLSHPRCLTTPPPASPSPLFLSPCKKPVRRTRSHRGSFRPQSRMVYPQTNRPRTVLHLSTPNTRALSGFHLQTPRQILHAASGPCLFFFWEEWRVKICS